MRLINTRDIVAIIILIALTFLFVFYNRNPELFLYLDSEPELYEYNPNIPPYRECTLRGCTWQNVPVGQENIYLRQVNEPLFYIYYYNAYINSFFLLIAGVLIYRNRKNLLKVAKHLNTSNNKD